MNSLNWDKIDTNQKFQQLVNDLFLVEINHPGFIPSSPFMGADGGWDGRYNGMYRGKTGLWSFQSKWTQKSFKDAFTTLRTALTGPDGELEKAKKNNVNFLVITTNAELKVDQVTELEELKGDYVDELYIYHREKLRPLIQFHPYLRFLYFDDPQEPQFVPANHYLTEQDRNLFFQDIQCRNEELKNLEEVFFQNRGIQVGIIHAPGGYGKTHFIFKALQYLYESSHFANELLLFSKTGTRLFTQAFDVELDVAKKYIIFVDDAERYLDEIEELAKRIQHTKNVRIIFTCRTPSLSHLKDKLAKYRFYSPYELALPNLPQDVLVNLIQNIVGDKKKIEHPERLASLLNGNLFLIIQIANFIKDRGNINPKTFKTKICTDLVKDFQNSLSQFNCQRQFVNKLIVELSALIPFPLDGKIVQELANALNVDVVQLKEMLESLIECGCLRLVGRSVRFNPDMLGDIYLSQAIDAKGKDLASQLISRWISICPGNILTNIAAAARHQENDWISSVMSGVVQNMQNNVLNDECSVLRKNLNILKYIADSVPDESVRLLIVYLDLKSDCFKADDIAPIIAKVIPAVQNSKLLLELIAKYKEANLETAYRNYEANFLIRKLVSPLSVNIGVATNTLSVLYECVLEGSNPSNAKIELAAYAAQEALQGSHEYDDYYANKITWGRKSLIYSEAVEQYRDEALKIVCALLKNPNDYAQMYGIDIIDSIGRSAEQKGQLWERIKKDIDNVLSIIEVLVQNGNLTLKNLCKLENVLLHIWAANDIHPDISQHAGSILLQIPKTPEYIIYKYYVSDYLVFEFHSVISQAPEENRWKWFVESFDRFDIEPTANLLDESVGQIANQIQTKQEAIHFFQFLHNSFKERGNIRNVCIIRYWYKYNPKIFQEIIKDSVLLGELPSVFHEDLHLTLHDNIDTYIDNFLDYFFRNVAHQNPENTSILLNLFIRSNLATHEVINSLTRLINGTNDEIILDTVLHRSYFIFKERNDHDKKESKQILITCLPKLNEQLVASFDFLLHHVNEWGVDLNDLSADLINRIKDFARIDHHSWELVKFTIDGNIDKLLDFIDYRLRQQEKKDRVNFDAIPHDGFDGNHLITNFDEYKQVLGKIYEWYNQDLLYDFELDSVIFNIENHIQYIKQFVQEKMALETESDYIQAIWALNFIPFNKNVVDLYAMILNHANSLKYIDKIKNILADKIRSRGYSRTVGEPCKSLEIKQENLLSLKNKTNFIIFQDYIDHLIRETEEEDKRHMLMDAEILNPRN